MTISLDTLDTERFREITGIDALQEVFEAIEAAKLQASIRSRSMPSSYAA